MDRVHLESIHLDRVTMDGAIVQITSMMNEQRSTCIHVATINAQYVHIAWSNSRFASILQQADLSVADGVPLVWACRLVGQPIPGRVNGTDLMVRLCEVAAKRGSTVYFLGGRPGAGEGAARRLMERFPDLRIAGIDCPPMGFMDNKELVQVAASRIEHVAPDFLFVGLGAPKQEYWIDNHRHLCNGVMVGVGGSFELIAGVTKRAPVALQRAGFEWLWRLAMDPRRLWKRYLMGNTVFVLLVFRQWVLGLMTNNPPEDDSCQIGR